MASHWQACNRWLLRDFHQKKKKKKSQLCWSGSRPPPSEQQHWTAGFWAEKEPPPSRQVDSYQLYTSTGTQDESITVCWMHASHQHSGKIKPNQVTQTSWKMRPHHYDPCSHGFFYRATCSRQIFCDLQKAANSSFRGFGGRRAAKSVYPH